MSINVQMTCYCFFEILHSSKTSTRVEVIITQNPIGDIILNIFKRPVFITKSNNQLDGKNNTCFML